MLKMPEKNYSNNYEEEFDLEKYNKKVTGAYGNRHFCVFRVGNKIKTLNQISMFEKHMERDMEVPNANPELQKYNRVIIGKSNVAERTKEYIYGIKVRSNGNLGVDLVLTAGHGFFTEMQPQEREKWIEENIKFLKDNFGENCLYACLHMDETTPHLHALIIPRFWNEDKNRYELRSNMYFDGPEKMREWQDKYADHMNSKFSNLMRGIRGSKAKHISIQSWYTLTGKKLDIKNKGQILAYAQKAYLLEKRVKALEYTLEKMNENGDTDKLLGKVNKLEKNNKVYKDTIKEISKKYGIKEKEILELVGKIQGKNNKNEREK
ncbi:MAG: hypothetical protein E7206_17630 [Clostridium beijerinckii]|nr:hypothetical protein [Clostridium beijerinckii]